MKFKAVLFDLDGTLLDTIDDLADSMNNVLEQLGFPTHNVDQYKYFVGDGMLNLVKRALPKDKVDEDTVNRCFMEMRNEYDMSWANKTKLYNGITELLNGLTAKNMKLAILSNKPNDFTKTVVEKYLSAWHFDAIFGERSNIPKKPHPSGAFEIAELLKLKTGDFLYLGDTNVDMKTANSAGMYAVGASWGFRTIDELIEAGAKEIIHHPVELLKLV
jgi:phosphoglycolate phosphatase